MGLKRKISQYRAAAEKIARYGVGTYGGIAFKSSFSNSGTRTRRKFTSGRGVTTQRDSRVIYQKRRMPAGRRRRWKRFVKRSTFVLNKNLGTQSMVYNSTYTQNPSILSPNDAAYTSLALYSANGALYNQDLYNIFNYYSTNYPRVLMNFKSAVLDLTLQNYTDEGEEPTPTAIELDIYQIVTRRSIPTNEATTFSTLYETGFTKAAGYGGAPALVATNRGATPFQAPLFTSFVKVIKKTKYFIPPGGTITYQMRDAKERRITGDHITENFAFKGITRGILIVYKNTTSNGILPKIRIGATRTYAFVIPRKEDVAGGSSIL